MGNKKG